MRPLRLKISDLAEATGYTRYQVRGLLEEAFPGAILGKKVGSQRTFSSQDLLVVAVVCEIEREYGVERRKLAVVADALRRTLTVPRGANRDARLLLTFTPPTATYIEPNTPVAEGLLVRLGPVFAKVDEFMGVSGPSEHAAQAPLPLRPTLASGRRGSSRTR
jgi:hypothetical protein